MISPIRMTKVDQGQASVRFRSGGGVAAVLVVVREAQAGALRVWQGWSRVWRDQVLGSQRAFLLGFFVALLVGRW